MYRTITSILILSFLMVASCSLFDSGKKRTISTGLNYAGSSAVVLDDSVTEDRAGEIYEAIKNDLSGAMESGTYKYGAKGGAAKTFTIDQLRVLIGSCDASSTKCDVEIFIDKGSDTMRPLFVTEVKPVSSCPDKYKAYIKSATLLSKEFVDEGHGYGTLAVGNTYTGAGSCVSTTFHDILCRKKNDISQYKKLSSYTISYGDSSFDVSTSSSSITVTNVEFTSGLSNNLVCISDLIKPSLWGKTRSNKDQTAVFKVSLEMVQ